MRSIRSQQRRSTSRTASQRRFGFRLSTSAATPAASGHALDVPPKLAREQRLLVTRDARTMIALATDRVSSGRAMPGVTEVSRRLSVGAAIEDIQGQNIEGP